MNAWRERKRLEVEQGGTAYTAAQAEQPITMARLHRQPTYCARCRISPAN